MEIDSPTSIANDEYVMDMIANHLCSEFLEDKHNTASCEVPSESAPTEVLRELNTGSGTSAVRRLLSFHVARQLSTFEWLAGVAGGEALVDGGHVNRWAAALLVGAVIGPFDYAQSNFLARNKPANKIDAPTPSTASTFRKEITPLASAVWQGAGPTITVDRSLGIESSRNRRKAHAAIYAGCVALWTTPIPPFRQLGDSTQSVLTYALDNPTETLATGGVISVATFGILEGIKKYRERKFNNTNDDKM